MENSIIPWLPDTGSVPEEALMWFVLAGVLGSLVRVLLDNMGLELPSVKENVLNLGFIGALIIGGVAGAYLGDSLLGSFSFGLSSSFLLKGLIKQ